MGYCLWLSGKKIMNLQELIENYEYAALVGYFLGGSLIAWLISIGEAAIAQRINDIDPQGNLEKQFAWAFGIDEGVVDENIDNISCEICMENTAVSSSFNISNICSSYRLSSYIFLSSFNISSYNIGSYSNNNNNNNGAGYTTSGSYYYGSYGSFVYGSFNLISSLYQSGSFGWFTEAFFRKNTGSFTAGGVESIFELLESSPLNKYGYGIYLI